MSPVIDVHSHVTPLQFPEAPNDGSRSRWPCMRCVSPQEATVLIGDTPFRKLDDRSWNIDRRLDDMSRDGIAMQVLSPMPELLSYWMDPRDAMLVCDAANHQIAEMVAAAPNRFRGMGSVPLQDPDLAAELLPRLKRDFGLSGVEIGSNINGLMLGDERFEPFWAAAQAEGMAVYVHALHPVAAKPIAATPLFTAFTLFPIDVAMAVASVLMAGVIDRHPGLRLGFSHGGGALGALLGRLDVGWSKTSGFGGKALHPPSEVARRLFFDSNVYDPSYLRHLVATLPGRVFVGTDYPYEIMQEDPVRFVGALGLDPDALASLHVGAASLFLDEELEALVARR